MELAVVDSPARTVPGVFEDMETAGVRNAVLLTAGFGEMAAAGRETERAILDVARRHGVRLIGPNSVGLVRPWRGMNASFLTARTPLGRLTRCSGQRSPSAHVLSGNTPMLRFMREIGFSVSSMPDDASLVTVERRI